MASLVDIFNPSFFMFLGILVLVAALLVVYFESKNREQNHKMTSMLNLITCMADEMNSIKIHLTHQTANFGVGGTGLQPQHSSLETNDIHIVKTDLIAGLVYTSCITASSSAMTCPFKAFSFSGLLMVMVKIPLSLWVSSVVYIVKSFGVKQPILECRLQWLW
jgi:hypothetical protein